ncbi:MAG: TlpA family protein disulfide reductase [Gemmatimonadota bacterium]|nr:TlpA family protein disulfide reductase [Gemmatimonadota bacterium]
MTARQQWSVVLGIVVVLGAALFAATHFLGDELFPVAVGMQAPPMQGETLVGPKRMKTLADYKGKVVLLNVWATWCGPCREEMPSMETLYREFGPQGLEIVAVSVDDPGSEKTILAFAKELGLTFEILHDPDKVTARHYQMTGYPESFIIGKEGTIRRKVFAAADWSSETNRLLIRELLGISTSATASR